MLIFTDHGPDLRDGKRVTMASGRNLTEGSILRSIVYLGIPTIATGFLQSAFNVIDMLFVGRLGPTALAAVSISGVVIALLITVAIAVSIGTLALVSRYWGAKHYRSAARVVGQSFYLSIFLSVLFGFGGWYLARPLLSLLGARNEVLELAVVYFRIISSGAWTIFIFVSFSAGLRGAGDAHTPFRVMALGVTLNIVLDPILIFGWLGAPALGVAGSAVATVFSRLISMGLIILLVVIKRSPLDLRGVLKTVQWKVMRRIFRIGFFSSLEMLVRSASMLALLRIVSPFGTAALAAYGIGARLRAMLLMPGIGLGYASGVLVGQNLGAASPKRARRTAWSSLMIYELMLIPMIGLLLLFPDEVIGFFNRDPEVLAVGKEFIVYIALSFIFMAVTIILGRSLNGAGDTAGPMWITAVCLIFVCIPLAYLGSYRWGWGVGGVWLAILIATILQGLLIAFRFYRDGWMDLKITAFPEEEMKEKGVADETVTVD